MALPPLITNEGLVLNNMMPDQGALGNYTPPGTASSEGISLMLRGIVRAAIATGDSQKTAFAHLLFDSACEIFFKGVRPSSTAGQGWHHSWIANGGAPFAVRGPLDPNGDLALGGFVVGRDPESTITFTNGVGQLNPPPAIVYQVVSANADLVWPNVFSDLNSGTRYDVEFYIDADGAKIFGTQKGGSFGQPAIPAGEHSDGAPGKVKLVSTFSGALGVNYSVSVPDVTIAYAELYEAWPMWRKLAANEVSTAGDAIHWFLDAFALGMELEPSNADWKNAHDRMMEVWTLTCAQESNNTRIFQGGTTGPYNNFPLTYSYAYGRTNVDDATSNWDATPPTGKYTAARGTGGYVEFTMPEENGLPGSGESIRYGVAFENSPLFLEYTAQSTLALNMKSSDTHPITVSIKSAAGETFDASVLVGPGTANQTVSMAQFLQFQQAPGDALGDKTGDWTNQPGEEDWEMPVYSAVPFPGRRVGIVGDSISWMNSFHNDPINPTDPSGGIGGTPVDPSAVGKYEYYGHGMCGYFTYANQLMGQRLLLEPGMQPDTNGFKNGMNFAIAGSRTVNWWKAEDDTLGNGVLNKGPMYAAHQYDTQYDVVVMMGGTNDVSGQITPAKVLLQLKKASTELAAKGKWVFLQTIMPRTRDYLKGFTLAIQDQIRANIVTINEGLRQWIAQDQPPNIWLVDTYAALLGPNGIDPAGSQSDDTDPEGIFTPGNYNPGYPGVVFFYDGLHPGPAGAFVSGQILANTMIAAGVPALGSSPASPITKGTNLVKNPGFTVTRTRPQNADGFSYVHGRAIGLGPAKTDGTHAAGSDVRNNVGLGYQFGDVPDYSYFYRENSDNDEGFSNHIRYTWEALSELFPNLEEYLANSSWADGNVTTEVVTIGGVPTFVINVDIPEGSNRNQGFVFRTIIPHGIPGPNTQYGYADWDYGMWPAGPGVGNWTNSLYAPGDKLVGEATVKITGASEMFNWRFGLNFLAVDALAVSQGDNTTTGAKISAFAHSQNFWPPSDLHYIKSPPNMGTMRMRTPVVTAPAKAPNEDQYYTQMNFEFAFDQTQGPGKARIEISAPGLYKVTGSMGTGATSPVTHTG